jgi:hypothetical protein
METLSAVMQWTYQAVATWYVAAIVGGLLIFAAERLSFRRKPSDADVRRAAERYRQWYGNDALAVIGDHILAASFAPDSRHKRFLKRVADELSAKAITDRDRHLAIEG